MNRKEIAPAKLSCRGFTLLEVSIIMIISSITLVGAIGAVESWMKQSALAENQVRLANIKQAIATFKTQHNRLPCPASFIAQPADAAPKPLYGREVTYPTTTGCGINPATGNTFYYTPDGANTFQATGRVGSTDLFGGTPPPVSPPPIIIGALPVRDLGLPDSYRVDEYGYQYTYAITQSEGTAPMNGFAGAIDIVDSAGNTVLPLASDTSPGTATYVVIDHGKDGKGAYTTAGIPSSTPCLSVPGLDQLNCNHTGTFRSAVFSRVPGLTTWFDDAIVYDTSLSTSTQSCQTIYSIKTATGGVVVPGTSLGYDQLGYDNGGGGAIGLAGFVIFFSDVITFAVDPPDPLLSPPGFTTVSPTTVAYCSSPSYHVVSGGCTQTAGSPKSVTGAAMNAAGTNGPVAAYGLDLFASSMEQIALPPLSHPALPKNGVQGWECNGSSITTMQTQAYVTCCTGGG